MKHAIRCALLLLLSITLGCRVTDLNLFGPVGPPPAGSLDVEVVRDVAYRGEPKADPLRHRLDVFEPKGKKDCPVVLLVHGGAWIMGDNRCCGLYSTVGHFLASQGIVAVLPNYRLSPGVKHPHHIQDVARALAWTRDNIARYGGDPKRIFLVGHSAGGHLVSLLATDESYLKAEGMKAADLKGVVSVSGVYRIPHGDQKFALGGSTELSMRWDRVYPLIGDSPLGKGNDSGKGLPGNLNVFGPAFGNDDKVRDDASPINHVRRDLPPFLILSAEKDLPTLPGMADEFHEALKKEGCDVKFQRIERRNHNSIIFSATKPDDPTAKAVLDFIKQHDKR